MAACLLFISSVPREANADVPVPAGEQNEMLRPPLQDGKPVAVSVALHVINLADIDEVSERFNLMCYLVAQWHDRNWVTKYISSGDSLIAQDVFGGTNSWGAWGRRHQCGQARCAGCWRTGSVAD
jgi:neurotransmitter-gated ion-channel